MRKYFNVSLLLIGLMFLLSACGVQDANNDGFFYKSFVKPMEISIESLASWMGGSYGLAIIAVTLIIRLIVMPFMVKQYKTQQDMKEKMTALKPELDQIQKKLKETKDPKEQQKLQQEMFGLYKTHGVNPLNMGCLPLLIQMPFLMGLYYAILGSKEIATHTFLWFDLGQPDIILTLLAGAIYYLQFKVSTVTMTEDQMKQMKFIGLLSPIMIMVFSFTAPAALPLYWIIGGIFLIGQTYLSKLIYAKKDEKIEAQVQPQK